jgi:copper chaperone CopZ
MKNLVKKKFVIEGMHCSSCAMNIDFGLEDINGVKSATTSYAKQECVVEFDPEFVNQKKLTDEVGLIGYKVKEIVDLP